MATTTNFGWVTPDNTDLVKDGASAIRTLGSSIDSSMGDLKGGTTGQVLSKTTGTDMDFTWVTTDDTNAIQNAIVDAKGDLIAATAADTPARLAVGTDYGFLQALASEATGLKWNSNAWTSYTNTVTAASGTFTTVSGTGFYLRVGKMCALRVTVSITTNGTASGNIKVTLPFTAGAGAVGVTRETQATGLLGQFEISGTEGFLTTTTNTYPGANNRTFLGCIIYEVA
jgi:hypothetical protein